MTRLEALEAVAEALRDITTPLNGLYTPRQGTCLAAAIRALDALAAAIRALDALPAAPTQAQGGTVEVAVWQHADGSTRFSRPNSPDDEWNGWRRLGTTRLPIRATVSTEGGGE